MEAVHQTQSGRQQSGRKRQRFDSYWHQLPARQQHGLYLGYRHTNTRNNCYEYSAFMMNPRVVDTSSVFHELYQHLLFKYFIQAQFTIFRWEKYAAASQPQCGCKHSVVKISSFLFSRTQNIPRTGWRMSVVGIQIQSRKEWVINPPGDFDSLPHPESRWRSSSACLCIVIAIIIIHIIFMHISHQ